MKPLEFWVTDDDANDLKLIGRALSKHALIRAFNDPNHCIHALEEEIKKAGVEGRSNAGPTGIILDLTLKGFNQDGVDVATYLKNDLGYGGTCVLTSGGEFTRDIEYKYLKSASIGLPISKEDLIDPDKAPATLDRMLKTGKFSDELVIGVCGLGVQGIEAVKGIASAQTNYRKNVASLVKGISNFWFDESGSPTEIGRRLAEKLPALAGSGRVKGCLSYDEFFSDLDILFITTGGWSKGGQGVDFTSVEGRTEEVLDRFMEGSASKIELLCEQMLGKADKSIKVMVSNAVEPNTLRLLDRDIKWARTTTSVGADIERVTESYIKIDTPNLINYLKRLPIVSDVHILVVGEHGFGIPLLSFSYVVQGEKKIPLHEINPRLKDEEYRIDLEIKIKNDSKNKGIEAQQAQFYFEKAPEDTRAALVKFAQNISSYQTSHNIHHFLHGNEIGYPDLQGVVMRPVTFNFREFLFSPDREFSFGEISRHWKKEIAVHLESTSQRFNKFYPKSSGANMRFLNNSYK